MLHFHDGGGETAMHIDHFNPHLPKHVRNNYENLFLASCHCNINKNDYWPEKEDLDRGVRYLNPCEEQDYGNHIWEDPKTFEVWSHTPAGKYHIRMMKLNSPTLIRERRLRHELRSVSEGPGIFEYTGPKGETEKKIIAGLKYAKDRLKYAIPPIAQRPKPDKITPVEKTSKHV